MSSGFISAGATEYTPGNDEEWQRVKKELEESRKRKAEQGTQDGGKSLYEILQQNKAAKQEAFEESIRLKNQFRALDEDEVEFLDSLLESTRAKEAAVKRETMEQLEMFHRQREEAEKNAFLVENKLGEPGAGSHGEEEKWAISGRKRRRTKDNDVLPGVKLRKSSSTSGQIPPQEKPKADKPATLEAHITSNAQHKVADYSEPPEPKCDASPAQGSRPGLPADPGTKVAPAISSNLGLGAYSSDDDDDDD
ncbi:hypothetical protein CIRG_09819 [Coccidioides immitis RMSCC 2394]|uniref:FAM192A/Fyv6 N-terminal domain-containing protein n=1 Tax=Coccidioides immitis RMSCC 2394 TaxID=404692 RepID=A0A0J6YQY1_COCIT|nr:hypothetical protein CIRG_09819 [Coccidioides immitis RMSCC 2394]